jgi:hypothetical protein
MRPRLSSSANRVGGTTARGAQNPRPAGARSLLSSRLGSLVISTGMKIPPTQKHGTAFRIARLASACTAALALWACGPVYIPVPPPGQVSFTAEPLTDATGMLHTLWTARGGPNGNAANATFSIVDRESGQGVITVAASDGSFVAGPMQALVGDRISISYRDAHGRESPAACRLLSDLPLSEPCP